MGVTSTLRPLATRVDGWLRTPAMLRRLALVSVIVNIGIVGTGGAVRLTRSGLGCPTWPTCVGSSLVPRAKLGINGVIEFSNRTLTFVVAIALGLTLLAAWRQRREVRLALIALLGIPAQAVLGGLLVLADLNPWLVSLHFLLSPAIIAVAFLLWWRVSPREPVVAPAALRALAAGLVAVAFLVLVAGTLVTGAGPHAGDVKNGHVKRIHLPIDGLAQLHADLVMILIGLTVGAVAAGYALHLRAVRKAALWLLALEAAQGAIGYTQYFLHVPPALVEVHVIGACLVWVGALWVLLSSRSAPSAATPEPVPAPAATRRPAPAR